MNEKKLYDKSHSEDVSNLEDGNDMTFELKLEKVFSNTNVMLMLRESECYRESTMSESGELISNRSRNKSINELESHKKNEPSEEVSNWIGFVELFSTSSILPQIATEIEEGILRGIPEELRGALYLRMFNIKYSINSGSFESMLKKAHTQEEMNDDKEYINSRQIDKGLKEILLVFDYCTKYVSPATSKFELMNNMANGGTLDNVQSLPPTNFVIHIAQLLQEVPGLDQDSILLLLLKFNKLFVNLSKGEFFYKINRTLEEYAPETLNHIRNNGIPLKRFCEKTLYNIFFDDISDKGVLMKILDFIVFEGFDFLLKLYAFLFKENAQELRSLEGEELKSFIFSTAFFKVVNEQNSQQVLTSLLSIPLFIIRFENEYYLIHANSLVRNRNELLKLQEVNADLNLKNSDLIHQIQALKSTFDEIVEQQKEYDGKLTDAQKKNSVLSSLKYDLSKKYERLTMNQNLINTLNANKEFQARNNELQMQVEQLKRKLDEKKQFVEKHSV